MGMERVDRSSARRHVVRAGLSSSRWRRCRADECGIPRHATTVIGKPSFILTMVPEFLASDALRTPRLVLLGLVLTTCRCLRYERDTRPPPTLPLLAASG